ncbi:MAG: flagellar hook-basal body complex protein [Synergistaceae bacterium]|nr:flagellar hook-basal body complex protein [Synergistaceae bacterium]MBQ3449022.1 flagellar hook-basal body complex protein [Synergistaceae bacterium]MBQ3694716.1 flagellar hook-basal body complex protein [Synergistaceae bacterium]MBQ6111618.1 flagellar hook-basal body complex protein [Synergistaceae bacterium]MBQ9628075.1 flagellar hook-basal body complex protein [Synergistaceae bacterium]
MLRSLFTAVTGVRAHQTMLDVTGNNISNANTTGFKKDNTIFADLMYQANKYASGAGDTRGGINPAQVGLGVSVSAIETIHTQGSGQYTGNAADMMIQDKGFFVYQDGSQQLYSRSGALILDSNSDMVMSGTGYRLQGYKMEETPLDGYQQAAELSTVNIPLGQKIDAKATTRVDYQCNLDSRTNAYLPYGFADIPFNVAAGWKGNSAGTARINMRGTEYDMSFTTDFNATYNNVDNTGTDVNYLDITIASSGSTSVLTFDMTDIDSETGKPNLSLPKIKAVYEEDGETIASYAPTAATGEKGLVGWLVENEDDPTVKLVTETEIAAIEAGSLDQDALDKYYTPVYSFPGQTPPMYFAAKYDDDTGTMKLRSISLLDENNNEIPATTAGLLADLQNAETLGIERVEASNTVFTYNVKDSMNYTSFRLSGAPTIATATVAEGEAVNVSYDFIAEFDESITVGDNTSSDMARTASKMTLWYYGYSNADAAELTAEGTAATISNGTVPGVPERMHKLEATVYFNPDGTFDSVEWADSVNDNAPLGYRIVDGALPDGTAAGPNFQIAVGSSSATSSKSDTLTFKQAQNLDSPGALDNAGVWTTQGTTYQGGYHTTKCTIYDDNGKTHTLEVAFKKLTENRWRWEAFLVEQDDSGEDQLVNIIPTPSSGEIEFDGSGRISNVVTGDNNNQRRGDGNERYPNAEVEISIPFSLNGQPNSTVTLNFGGGVGSGGSALDGVTQFASETTTKPVYQNGYTMGVLKNYSVAQDGVITGSYDNGVNIPLYRVALATFANEQGLEKVGNTMFKATVNSGNANIDGATTNGKGSIMSQYLEMSNVDLTEEFTHLIIAQRGFQANTRVVTVSDQILEEVVNLKR